MPQTGYLCWCHLAQKLEFCKGKHQMVGVYNFVSNLLIYPEGVYPPLLSQCALFCRSLLFSIPSYPSSWFVHVHFCLLYFIALTPYINSASHSHTLYHVLYLNEVYAWFTMFTAWIRLSTSVSILIVGLELAQWKQTGPRWMIRHTFMDLAK